MSAMKDLLESLNALAIWRRLTPLPDEVADLRQRIEQLEARMGAASVGGLQQCPMCNSLQFRRTGTAPHPVFGRVSGLKVDSYHCQTCGHQETRERDESA